MKKQTKSKSKEEYEILLAEMKTLIEKSKLTAKEKKTLELLFDKYMSVKKPKGTKAEREDYLKKEAQYFIDNAELVAKIFSEVLNNNKLRKFYTVYKTNKEIKKLKKQADKGDLKAQKKINKILDEKIRVKIEYYEDDNK